MSLLAPLQVMAAEIDVPFDTPPLQVHGFVSQGFLKSTANNYLAESRRGSFELTEIGLNFTQPLADDLRVGAQLFARDLGPLGDYAPRFDWFYIDFRYRDWLGLRVGRTKLPYGLYNETNDVDVARVPVLLPQSVYPTQNRDFLLAQTGLELYGYVPLGRPGALEYRLYGGTIFIDASQSSTVGEISVPYVVGGRLLWQTPLAGLQVGGSLQALRLDIDLAVDPATTAALAEAGQLPADFDGSAAFGIPAVLWVASAEYASGDLSLAAEYSRWHLGLESSLEALYPDSKIVSERAYAMASYRVTPWFTPGAYYSVLFPDVDQRAGRAGYQHDVAVTCRYDIHAHWLFKLEGHLMHGTAGLNSSLNDDTPLADLTKTWGVILAKTTAYF